MFVVKAMLLNFCRQFRTSSSLGRARHLYFNKHKPVKDASRQDPDYFEKQAATLSLDSHYIDNLKLLWEEKIGNERELMMKASDSLIGRPEGDYGLPEMAPLRPRIEYEDVAELKDAPEEVKKLFSIEFGERSDYTAACKKDLIALVKKHRYDQSSLSIKIAWSTVIIRHLTALIDDLATRDNRRPTQFTHKIHFLLGYRRRLLGLLREQDYGEFEKTLDTLKISYQVPKQPDHVKTRKAWSLFALQKRVDAEKERMMEELRAEFEQNKDVRLQELNTKLDTLDKQQHEIEEELKKFEAIDGRALPQISGKYQPKLVEELTEFSNHQRLFYHPAPSKQSA